jgi:hypothetical protein
LSSGGAAPLPATTTTTETQIAPSPVKLTITQLAGGATVVTAQKVGGGSCLCEKDVQPVPGDPQATIGKLQKVLSEAAQAGGPTSDDAKLLAEARQALADAQKKVTEQQTGKGEDGSGINAKDIEPDNDADDARKPINPLIANYGAKGNQGIHTPQGVSAGSLSVFA